MLTLDSNILIYYLQDEKEVVKKFDSWRTSGERFCISIITKIELLSYPKITAEEIEKVNKFLREFQIIILDEVIATKVAEIRRKYKLLLADAIIATTAFFTKSTLITRNIKHFRKIKEIKVKSI